MKKRILALMLALALALSLAACSGKESPSASETGNAGGDGVDLTQSILSYASGLSSDETLLTVNGQEIPADLFLYCLAYNCYLLSYQYSSLGLTLGSLDSYAESLLADSISMTASYAVLEQKAQQHDCPLTEEQRTEIQTSIHDDTDGAYEEFQTLYGLSDSSIMSLYSSGHYYDNLLEALISPTPTTDELNNYVYQVKHILIKTTTDDVKDEDGNVTQTAEEYNAAQKELADDLLAQLQSAGDLEATFDTLMNEYSEDGRDNDGNLYAPDGYTATLGEMAEPFETASLALAPGQLSGIVESNYGYHIILRGEVEDPDSYIESWRDYQLNEMVDQWMEEADIVEADLLKALDVADFYERFTAYQEAYLAQQEEAEAGDESADPETTATP